MINRVSFKIVIWIIFLISFCNNIIGQNKNETSMQLSARQQRIIQISAYTAKGDLENAKLVLNNGLDDGLTINEIKELLVHLYAYCGFPRSIRGLQTFMEVLDERRSKGIIDNIGIEASPIDETESKYERGKAILEKLTGKPQSELKNGYAEFAPIIEIFLKEHLFADIFERDVLTFAERELITISVLASIGGVEPMLRSHFQICLVQGFTPHQLNEFLQIISSVIGNNEIQAAEEVLNDLLSNYKK
ncbi:MAG: carboxymuconolactone decarboxylase family protein [Ignavibacteriae bacterium]|nr:carboxymuconolactone decarboxylase family protein [Ignavibacteriota bacterium]